MVNAVTYILENDSTVRSLVGMRVEGVTTDSKVFPVVVPQSETAPYIAVRQVGKLSSGKDCGHDYNIQISSYAKSYDAVSVLNEAVKSALEGQDAGTVNGVDYGFINFSNEVDDYSIDHELYIKVLTMDGNAN